MVLCKASSFSALSIKSELFVCNIMADSKSGDLSDALLKALRGTPPLFRRRLPVGNFLLIEFSSK